MYNRAEAWRRTAASQRKLSALEMYSLKRWYRFSRFQRISKKDTRKMINVKTKIIQNIQKKQLIGFAHVKRMDEKRLRRIAMNFTPRQKKKRGRHRKHGVRK